VEVSVLHQKVGDILKISWEKEKYKRTGGKRETGANFQCLDPEPKRAVITTAKERLHRQRGPTSRAKRFNRVISQQQKGINRDRIF